MNVHKMHIGNKIYFGDILNANIKFMLSIWLALNLSESYMFFNACDKIQGFATPPVISPKPCTAITETHKSSRRQELAKDKTKNK